MQRIVSFMLAIAAATGLTRVDATADETAAVQQDDRHIAAAIREARSRLAEFLALADKPGPAMHTFSIKLAVPVASGAEFIWITPFKRESGHFIGQISNDPRNIKGVERGQWIQFDEDDIVDWTYHYNGKRKGNFTAHAIAKRLPPAETERFLQQYNLTRDP